MANGKHYPKLPDILRVQKVINYGTLLYGLAALLIWWYRVEGVSMWFTGLYCVVIFGSAATNRILQYYGVPSGKRRGGFYVAYLLCCYLAMEFGNAYTATLLHQKIRSFPEGFPFSVIEAVGLYILSLNIACILHCKSDGCNYGASNNVKGGGSVAKKFE